MISNDTIKSLRRIIKIGNFLNIFPFKWNPSTQKLELITKYTEKGKPRWEFAVHKITLAFDIFVEMIVQWLITTPLLWLKYSLEEGIIASIITIFHMISLLCITTYILFGIEHVHHINFLLELNKYMGLYYKTDPIAKDGIEKYLVLAEYFAAVVCCIVPAMAYFVISYIPLFHYLNTSTMIGNMLASLFVGYWFVSGVLHCLFVLYECFIHVNATAKWMKLTKFVMPNREKPMIELISLAKHQVLRHYRILQLFHYKATHFGRFAAEATLLMLHILLICLFYGTVKGFNQVPFLRIFLGIASVFAPYIVDIGLKLTTDFTKSSEEFKSSFHKNCKPLTNWEKCFLRSCPKLCYQFETFTASRNLFLTIMQVVVTYVINLLLL